MMNFNEGACGHEDFNCNDRLDHYDALICHWSYDVAFAEAFGNWDWRVFTIADWFLDEVDDYKEDHQTIWTCAVDHGGLRTGIVVRIAQAWQWMKHAAFRMRKTRRCR